MNNRNKRSDPESELYRAILQLKSIDECYDFFLDLCTVSELKAMEQRFEVAKLLNERPARRARPSRVSTAASTTAPMPTA